MADIKTIGVRDVTLDNCIHLLDDVADGSLRGNTATFANKHSIAVGEEANASGENSQAFGAYTTANGEYSHAEGSGTTASGDMSHAECRGAVSSGKYSHAEGFETTASGDMSHAEGHITTASGKYSHAEGSRTTASGRSSHAEGNLTVASGINSHAGGEGTIARGKSQTAIGEYNVADGTTSGRGTYAFIIGRGTQDEVRRNALTVDWDGNLWIAGALTQGSDKRLKEHIGYLGDDAVEFVRKLKPAHYTKDDASHVGFYAQDVEEEDKWECMVGEDAMGYKTLGYTELIAPLVAYCQHLEKRIEELEKKGE